MTDKAPHFVVGHRNPDADAIVSAYVLAWHYNQSPGEPTEAQPIRLGAANNQVRWLFNQAGCPMPILRESCLYTAGEMAHPTPLIRPDAPLRVALETMQKSQRGFVAVTDDADRPIGIISDRTQRTNYLLQCNVEDFIGTLLHFSHLIEGLPLRPLQEAPLPEVERLEVPMHKHSIQGKWDAKTAIVIGDRDLLLNSIREHPPAVVILTGVSSERAEAIAGQIPCPCFHFSGSAISMFTRLPTCFPASEAMVSDYVSVSADAREDEINRAIKKSPLGLMVADDEGRVVGSISPMDILNLSRPKVSLVDHSEKAQSIHGIDEAEIVEIVDHHRLGDIETYQPLRIDARPVGSTASILYDRICESDTPLPVSIAKLLLGALISDTLLLTSPTCTDSDKERAEKLALTSGVDLHAFGIEVLRQNDELKDGDPQHLVRRDCKAFQLDGVSFLAAQIETVDLNVLLPERSKLLERAFAEEVSRQGKEFGALMITDVLAGRSRLSIVSTDEQWPKRIRPEKNGHSNSIWEMDGFVSRKKQLIPLLFKQIREG